MRIGILGAGNVGQSLAAGFVSRGHDVRLGTRRPQEKRITAGTPVTYEEAARHAELALLCTAWSGTENAIRLAGPGNLTGKVVIDVTNPLDTAGGGMRLAIGHSDSAGERVQTWLPKSLVVKCFNIINHAYMVDPDFPGGPPDMFLCGNDDAAKRTVTEICNAFGWPGVIDIGAIEGARLLEPLAMLWIECGLRWGSWDHAWKLLRR